MTFAPSRCPGRSKAHRHPEIRFHRGRRWWVAETQLSAMMANSIGQSKALEKTYAPIQIQTVRAAKDARSKGRQALRENR